MKDSSRRRIVFFLLPAVLCAAPAAALDTFFAGPRAMGMGGANIASVSDTSAQYYNPAAFGFFGRKNADGSSSASDNNDAGRKDWGVDVGAGAGYRLHGEFGSYLDTLADIDPDQLSLGINDESDLADLINLVSSVEGIADAGNAVTTDFTAGLGIRAGNFAIGIRSFMQANGSVDELDRDNLGFDIPAAQLQSEINGVNLDGFNNTGYQIQVFTLEQRDSLAAALGSLEAANRLDFVAAQEGIAAEDVAGAVDLLETAILTSGTTDMDNNTTSVLLRGFGVAEVPISYGYAINDHFSIGANLKVMQGRVYGNKILVFDEDADDILGQTSENYEDTINVGVDVGVMARFPMINLGIVGRNLNSPKFNGMEETEITLSNGNTVILPEVDDVTIKPQVAAGVAFIPFKTLTLEVDYDLTKNETAFDNYETQNLGFGLEWDAFRFLALRAGTYKNLAEDDIDWVYTAGLGLNLWAIRLDVAGAFAEKEIEFDGDEIPQETRVTAQLSVDF